MRLAAYIVANTESIIREWEDFAATSLPAAASMEQLALRNHVVEILAAIVTDMNEAQSSQAQSDKSQGLSDSNTSSIGAVAIAHAAARHADRFSLVQVLAEFRALRASVIRLWSEGKRAADQTDLVDIVRFDETVDELVAQSAQRYTDRVNESKDLLLGVIGHELRDPLATVSMSADLLAQHARLEPPYATVVERQKKAAERMRLIIADLFDVTAMRLGTGMGIVPVSCDLGAIFVECIHEFQATHPGRDIAWESLGDCRGQWDESRLRQVLTNLLGNAVKHGNGEPIKVSVRGDASNVVLAVTNHGPVISEGERTRIFTPLARGEGKRPDTSGLGLGLFITQAIVEGHRGTISCDSSVNGGTRFTVSLPKAELSTNL